MVIVQGINDHPRPRPDITDLWVVSGPEKAAYIMKDRSDRVAARGNAEHAATWRLRDVYEMVALRQELSPQAREIVSVSLDALATSFHELLGITERWADVFKEMDALRFRTK